MGVISIEGKEFFGSAEFMLDADTVTSDQPGDDSSFITDMGVGPLTIRVRGDCTENTDSLSDVRKAIMTIGELELILDTGWKYKVFRRSFRPVRVAGTKQTGLNGYHNEFEAVFVCEAPYQFTTTDNTRSKAITANNETWTADDSGNALSTDGEVDAVPDIQVTGGAVGSGYNRTMGYDIDDTDASVYSDSDNVYTLKKTFTYLATVNLKWNLEKVGLDQKTSNAIHPAHAKYTYQAASLNGGAETDVPGGSWSTLSESYVTKSGSPDITCAANETLTIRMYLKHSQASGYTSYGTNLISNVNGIKRDVCKDAQIYNTTDSTVKCDASNEIETDMVVKINTDGTGTIEYEDDFSNTKYLDANWHMSGVTRDAVNDELDIADDGYIYYKTDAKYPITGIPTLTSRINITSGTPTIQISTDAATWYDIDTAIVDDVDTEYELDDSTNLSLKGQTSFYFRIDCVKAGAATCSVKSFELNVNIVTIDAENPVITEGGSASTFRCDQDSDSGMNCTVVLIYPDRRWPG